MLHEPIWHRNKGKPPRNKTIALGIRWQNGMTSKQTYTADKLRWTLTGSDFDVAYFCRAE